MHLIAVSSKLLCFVSKIVTVSPLEYIVMLGNQFSSITMYSNGDADASAATDARCGQTLSLFIIRRMI